MLPAELIRSSLSRRWHVTAETSEEDAAHTCSSSFLLHLLPFYATSLEIAIVISYATFYSLREREETGDFFVRPLVR